MQIIYVWFDNNPNCNWNRHRNWCGRCIHNRKAMEMFNYWTSQVNGAAGICDIKFCNERIACGHVDRIDGLNVVTCGYCHVSDITHHSTGILHIIPERHYSYSMLWVNWISLLEFRFIAHTHTKRESSSNCVCYFPQNIRRNGCDGELFIHGFLVARRHIN